MRFEFIHAEKANYPVTVLCSVMCVSQSGYYRWRNRNPSERQLTEERRILQIRAIHSESRGTYGSPRVCAIMQKRGEVITEKTVARIMKIEGLAATQAQVQGHYGQSDHQANRPQCT